MSGAATLARSVLDRFEAAIADSDLAAAMSMCTPHVVLFGSASTSVGAAATRDYLRQVMHDFAWIRWVLDPLVVVHAGEDRVLVAGFGEVHWEQDEDATGMRSPFRLSLAVERLGDQWLIAHFHGSVPEGG